MPVSENLEPLEGFLFPSHQLHDDELHAVGLADVVDGADVGMVERRDGARLALEPLERQAVGDKRWRERLQRDDAIEPRIARPIHFAHSARAERAEHLIRSKAGAGCERQTGWIIPPRSARLPRAGRWSGCPRRRPRQGSRTPRHHSLSVRRSARTGSSARAARGWARAATRRASDAGCSPAALACSHSERELERPARAASTSRR